MKKLAWLIVVVAILAAIYARKPSPHPPENSSNPSTNLPPGTPTNTNTADANLSAPSPPQSAPPAISGPSTSSSPSAGPQLPSPANSTPITLAPVDLGQDPPDVIAETLNPLRPTEKPVPQVLTTPSLSLMVKADREGDVNGCKKGELLLNGSGIHFVCPSDDRKSVTLAIAQIKRVNKNGVEALNGHKYHFDIQNASHQEGEQMFHNWLRQVQSTAKNQTTSTSTIYGK